MAVTYPCYFGAWDPANDNFTDWSGMQKFAAAPVKSSSMYIGWNTPYSYFGAFNDLCASHGVQMYLNIEPWNAYGGGSTPSMQQIGSGAGDAYLTQLATDLKNAGHSVLMCFAHEMNGTWYPWGAQTISAAQWVTTWKHVYTLMKNIMGGLLTGVWCPNNNDVGAVSPYWPGSQYVDLAAADMYINNTGQTFASFNQNTVNEIKSLTSGPIWNAETGITLGTYSITSWVNDMANAGLYGFTQWNEGSFALSSANIATMCAAVNAWNNSAGPVGTTYTYTQTVYDNFSTNPTTNGKWNLLDGTNGLSWTSGTLSIAATAGAEAEMDTASTFDTTTGLWAVQYSHTGTASPDTAGDGSTGTQSYFGFYDASSHYCELQTWPASNEWYSWADGVGASTSGDTGAQNTFGSAWNNGDWLGIGNYNINGDNRIHVYKSSNGTTWTEIASFIITGAINMSAVHFFMGTNQFTGSSTWVSKFQNASTFLRGTGSGGGTAVITSTGGLVRSPFTYVPGTSGNNNPGGSQTISVTVAAATQAGATAGVAKTNSTVSPTAGSMVLVSAVYMLYNAQSDVTFTCQDNLGNVYGEKVVESDGLGYTYSMMFEFQYGAAPGPVSFVITASSQGVADCLIQPYILTGQASDQSNAATAKLNSSSPVSVCEINIQNTMVGSVLFVAGGLFNTATPDASTIQDSLWSDTNSGDEGATGHSVATTAIGPNTLGWTISPTDTSGYGMCAVEVIPASTNTSSPAGSLTVVTGTTDEVHTVSGVATQATSFSPPSGGLARICASWLNATDQTGKTFTCVDNHGNTYRATKAGSDSDGGCYLLVFDFVYSSAPGATTVKITAAGTGATATADCLIQPYIVTGQASNPYGASNSVNGNTSINTCKIDLTPTQINSRVWVLGAPNNANHPVPTAVSGTTTDSEWDDNNVGAHGVIGKSTSATSSLVSTTYGWTLSTASVFGFGCVAAEIVPAGSVGSGLVRSAPAMSGAGAVSGGATFTANGTIGSATTNPFSITPHSSVNGEFILCGIWSETAADWATALAGTGIAWTLLVAHTSFTAQSGVETLFIGKPTVTTAVSNTITFNTGSPTLRIAWQEFNASAGYATIALDASNTVDTASNGHYPNVTPTHGPGGLYWSFCFDSVTNASGNTPGCVYQQDANGNGMVYDLSCGTTALQPNTGNADGLSGIGVILYQSITSLAGNMVRPGPAMAGTGTTSIVNVSGTGSLTYGAPAISVPEISNVATAFPTNNLNMKFEMLVNGSWVDISDYVYQRNDTTISRGLPNETQQTEPSSMTFTLNNRDGRFSTDNPNGAYAPYLTRNTQIRTSIVNQASSTGKIYSGYRFWGELASIPPSWDSTGTDVYVQAVVNGPLRRYVQGAKIGSALYQYYFSLAGTNFAPYAVWPAEDGDQATEIASIVPGTPSMTFAGKPFFSSNNSFGGSDNLPNISGSTWHGETGASADPPGSGSILNNAPGTYDWICPPGVTTITNVTATGSGGGGGDTDGTIGGSGGGGGGTGLAASLRVTPGNTYLYNVAAGGSAGSGGPGSNGGSSSFTGDDGSVLGSGGGGGAYAGGSGGVGGAGTHIGGKGANGQSSTTADFQDTVYGSSGANGGGTDAPSGANSKNWTAPPTVTTATVNSLAAGGGASAGRGNTGEVGGGNGGGGGAFATGTIDVTPGQTYSPYAGNGGNGGSGSPGGGKPGPTNSHGDVGGNSGMVGDSSSNVIAGGGGGGGSAGPGMEGNVVSGGGNSGGQGGAGTAQVHGGGGSGGGPASSGGFGVAGSPGNGDSGGANRVAGDGGSVGGAGQNGSEYGRAGAGGGGGGCNATVNGDGFYGPSGGGGSGGWTNWQWTVTGAPVGGGGGAAATSTANGANGNTNGTGGGSTGGSAGDTPAGRGNGGGGAGATPSNDTVGNQATPPGPGANGSVGFSWSGGNTSPVANDIIRFLLEVDTAGAADGAILLRALTYGTIGRADLVYHTGGKLELIGYNASSVQIFDSGKVPFNADGNPLYMSIELTSNGGVVNWSLKAVKPGASQLQASVSGSVVGSVGNVSDIFVDPAGTVVDFGTALGWITIQTYAENLLSISKIANGYAGELAADRMARLCAAQGLGFQLVGNASDTPQMGPQQDDTMLNVLQSCADLDRGLMYETVDQFGVGYRTRASMQAQAPKLIAYYSKKTLATAPQPVADDQFTRNDITMTRNNGASARTSLTSGPMSIQVPPNGVGDYTYGQTVYAYTDSQLAALAAWVLILGTVSGYRFPQITFDMSRAGVQDLFDIIPTMDMGDYLQIPDPPTFLQTSPISQLLWGYTEVINSRKWVIQMNAVPEAPYAMLNPPTW